ncbi:MAG TPA: hypothetical protein VJL87_06660, partial [Bdellovibrionota bacterium]|nr:hypothetical protein [Bdellovibrionota bacterium]
MGVKNSFGRFMHDWLRPIVVWILVYAVPLNGIAGGLPSPEEMERQAREELFVGLEKKFDEGITVATPEKRVEAVAPFLPSNIADNLKAKAKEGKTPQEIKQNMRDQLAKHLDRLKPIQKEAIQHFIDHGVAKDPDDFVEKIVDAIQKRDQGEKTPEEFSPALLDSIINAINDGIPDANILQVLNQANEIVAGFEIARIKGLAKNAVFDSCAEKDPDFTNSPIGTNEAKKEFDNSTKEFQAFKDAMEWAEGERKKGHKITWASITDTTNHPDYGRFFDEEGIKAEERRDKAKEYFSEHAKSWRNFESLPELKDKISKYLDQKALPPWETKDGSSYYISKDGLTDLGNAGKDLEEEDFQTLKGMDWVQRHSET